MKYLIDLHVHTIGSHHAYSTIEEIAKRAAEKGLTAIAMTDHGPGAPDGPHRYYFSNMKVIPKIIDGVRIFKGVEASYISEDGALDLEEYDLNKLEIVLAGFHKLTPYGDSCFEKNTRTLINAIKRGHIDIITHPGNPQYPFDYELVLKTAKENDVAIEINNSSFTVSREGSTRNCQKIIEIAKRNGNYLSLGSDAHISFDVGNLEKSEELIEAVGYNTELIINRNIESVEQFLRNRRKKYEKKVD